MLKDLKLHPAKTLYSFSVHIRSLCFISKQLLVLYGVDSQDLCL